MIKKILKVIYIIVWVIVGFGSLTLVNNEITIGINIGVLFFGFTICFVWAILLEMMKHSIYYNNEDVKLTGFEIGLTFFIMVISFSIFYFSYTWDQQNDGLLKGEIVSYLYAHDKVTYYGRYIVGLFVLAHSFVDFFKKEKGYYPDLYQKWEE